MAEYGKSDYWDERYSRDLEPFDWYQRFDGFRDIIAEHIDENSKILNVGCGNSRMSEEMYEEGYINIVSIDISSVVIKAMQEKYKDKGPTFKYIHMDARAMDFEDSTFNCVLDKGTLDAILVSNEFRNVLIAKCGENSDPNTQKVISEVHRVLASGGVYILISFGTPDQRLQYLNRPEYNWKVLPEKVVPKPSVSLNDDKEAPNHHYVYICKKNAVEHLRIL